MAEKEYIDRERLFNSLNAYNTKFNAEINSIILSIPKENVQEVRHGKWIKSKNERKCSLCGYFYFTNTKSFNYCPHCGAKMNKE